MTTVEALADALDTVREEIPGNRRKTGIFSRRIFRKSMFSIHAGISMPSGLPQLIFVVNANALKALKIKQETQGFGVYVESFEDKGKRFSSVRISVSSKAFNELFIEVASDLIDTVLSSNSEKTAMRSLVDRLFLWRRFMESCGSDGLSKQKVTGLFGELSFLDLLLDQDFPPLSLMDSWTGPDGSNQDFMVGPAAVEVKSSSANEANMVTISNLRQLDCSGLEKLFLFHAAFDRREGSGQTLPGLVDEISVRLKAISMEAEKKFKKRLLASGYLHSQRDLYRGYGFSCRYFKGYTVTAGFPRIIETDVPNGIASVSYIIDLSAASSFQLNLDVLFSQIAPYYVKGI